MNIEELYHGADEDGIPILFLKIPENGSMCIQTENNCYIGMDYGLLKNEADKLVHLAHELGHCKTGAFYNRWAARDIRQKHEHKADKWAIEHTITADELDDAIAEGCGEYWQLAERFGVTEDFMKKIVCWYTYGNLEVEKYL